MQATDECVPSDWPVNYASAARELEDVLSRGLPALYRCAYRLLGNVADAEDAVQDALFSAYKHLPQFRGEAQMLTWLNAIVSNCARMQLRRRPRQHHMSLDERIGEKNEYSLSETLADARPNPEDECEKSELNAQLKTLAEELSPRLRQTFQLRDIDGLSIYEASRVLGIPIGTVKARLARARFKLKQAMRRVL